jgi:hypothetical protein
MNFLMNREEMLIRNWSILDEINYHYINRIHRSHPKEILQVEHQNRIQWQDLYNLLYPMETRKKEENVKIIDEV